VSTNSIIAVPEGDTWRGRFAHWDGYPEAMGKNLWAIVQRDGLDAAAKTLTEDHAHWSTIDPGKMEPGENDTDGCLVEPGYGVYHDDDEGWILPEGDKWGTEWLYVLAPGGLMVGKVGWDDDDVTPVGIFPWNGAEPDWKVVACGEHFETCCHMAYYHVDDLPEDAKRLSMSEWLGHEPAREPSHVLFEGQRLRITGSGHLRRASWLDPNDKWIGTVTTDDGRKFDMPLYTYGAKGNYKGLPGRKYEYPATAVAPAHVRLTPAGGKFQKTS